MARRSRRRKSGNSIGLIVSGILFVLLSVGVLGAFFYLKLSTSNVALDKATLCPVDGPTEITAILLDVTDPVSDTTALDLRNQFQSEVSNVPTGGLIQVYTLTENEGQLELTFSGCNPGAGANSNSWTSNPRLAQERWEKGFQKPLAEISTRMTDANAGKQSPIMAGIQKINLEAFSAPAYKALPKRLIIASDMIEHTASFSNYRDGVDYQKFEKSAARDQFRTSLSGVSVRLLDFQRPGLKFDGTQLAEFWTKWIVANGGQMDGFVRLEGVR